MSLRGNFGALFVIVVMNYLADCALIDYNNPVAQTQFGQVQGRKYQFASYNNPNVVKQVVAFIGIPYARSPTGQDRFSPPQDPEPWSGEIKDVTNNRVMCPQVDQRFTFTMPTDIRESEDCLHLNIYVPVNSMTNNLNMPVLVYFHGGEFKWGGKDMYKPDYLLDQSMIGQSAGIVVVTVNYRLGVLGFLSTDDINQPGNLGIRDQRQALRWVAQNIGNFNGNSANITIMGHDAGGISVSMHVLSQDSWPYFTAAISIGGTVFTPWAFMDNQRQQAYNFGGSLRCDLQTDRLVNCLRGQDLGALIGRSRDRDLDNNYQPFWFRPVIDRNVSSPIMQDYPAALYQTGHFKKVPYIVGFTKQEGSLEFYLQYQRLSRWNTIEQKIAFLIRPFLRSFASEDIIASAIKFQYFTRNQSRSSLQTVYNSPTGLDSNLISRQQQINQQQQLAQRQSGGTEQQQIDALIQMLGDFLYIAPADYVARLHSAYGGRSWMFAFEYEGSKSFGPLQRLTDNSGGSYKYGVTHMDDVFSVLPNEYIHDSSVVMTDRVLASAYSTLFVALVQTGTIQLSVYQWQQYTPNTPNYLLFPRQSTAPISQLAPTLNQGYRVVNSDFFNDYVYELQFKTAYYPQQFPNDKLNAYEAATWSLTGFAVLIIIILVVIIVVILIRRRNKNELKLVRRQDRELDERDTSATEKL